MQKISYKMFFNKTANAYVKVEEPKNKLIAYKKIGTKIWKELNFIKK